MDECVDRYIWISRWILYHYHHLYHMHQSYRNLSFLVNECSWYCKPLLLQVMALLHRSIQPVYANCNDFNLIACAVISSPFLLRAYHPITASSVHLNKPVYSLASSSTTTPLLYHQHEIDQLYMSATAVGSTTIEFLLSYYQDIFQTMHVDYSTKHMRLHHKCHALMKLYTQLQDIVDVNYIEYLDANKEALVKELWLMLADAELHVLRSMNYDISE